MPNNRRWSRDELEYLLEHRRDGAVAIAGKLYRSPDAVRKKASEIGVSLMPVGYESREVCPQCGARGIDPKTVAGRNGICEVCHKRNLTDAERDKAALIRANAEYNAARQDTFRARRGQ